MSKPSESNVEPLWIDIILRNGDKPETLTLRIRRDNYHLDGYQMADGEWLEFDRDDGETTHLIPGSKFLGFTGSYADLERVGQRPITGMKVTRDQVLSAIDELALASEGCVRARHLALLIIVICEGSRSEEVEHRIVDVMEPGSTTSMVVEEWMVEPIRARGNKSQCC